MKAGVIAWHKSILSPNIKDPPPPKLHAGTAHATAQIYSFKLIIRPENYEWSQAVVALPGTDEQTDLIFARIPFLTTLQFNQL